MKFNRKKMLINSGIFFGSLILILILVCAGYIFLMNKEIKKMTPVNSQEIIKGAYAVKDAPFVNFFVIKGKSSYIAIDAGANSAEAEKELKKLNIDPDKITDCFLTHTDFDHIAAIKIFKNAKFYISKDEEQMVNGQTGKILFFKNKINIPFILFNDNQTYSIDGVAVRCILTPGHTPGSASYLVNDKYLFTGDNLSLINGKVQLFNNFFNMDSKAQESSIKKLSSLNGVEYIFTAHYGISNNFKEAFGK